jgi:hypothetical protein
MRLNFLCKNHRCSLEVDPAAARAFWLETQERLAGEAAVPTPHRVSLAGSALEAAGIYLLASPASDAATLQRYVNSALQLIELLTQVRQTRLGIVVVAGATALVEHLGRSGADRDAVLGARRRLTLEGMQHVELSGAPRPGSRAVPETRAGTALLH